MLGSPNGGSRANDKGVTYVAFTVLALGVAVKATYVMPLSLARVAICAASMSSVLISPPSPARPSPRRKHLLEFCRSLSSLRGMRLIGDDGKRLTFGGRQLTDLFERERKRLDGADDDLLALCQRLRQLSALAVASDLMVATTPVVRWKSNSAS